GDVNGDGRAEIVHAGHDRADLYLGGPTGPETAPAWTAEAYPFTHPSDILLPAPGGDVNGDGKGDFLVGDRSDDGSIYVYLGGCAAGGPDSDGDHIEDACDACPGGDDATYDADHDGACALGVAGAQPDCDDADPTSFPGAPEACDGHDNACLG